MGSGPGYSSARAWASECEAKRPPTLGQNFYVKKTQFFPEKHLKLFFALLKAGQIF